MDYKEIYEAWLANPYFDEKTKEELRRIADDEKEIRQGIIQKIDWQANGFILAGDAANGREALELAQKIHPDVVMTDIKMPFMSGLELGEILAVEMPLTKLVLFSGFDDFEYAKQQNIKTIWALALPGKVAPLSAAEYIKSTLYHILQKEA